MHDYLTTKELAELLRIKERKVYDLAASGAVPCSRATGKLLFPRAAIEAWLAEHSSGPGAAPRPERPNVFLGSHDPLLDWALRQSGCGMATYFDGSLDGLARFANEEGVATGLHVFDATEESWNVSAVRERFADREVVLVQWAVRERGLIVAEGLKGSISEMADLAGRNVVPRQSAAGAQSLFLHLLGQAGLKPEDISFAEPARSEADAALAVREGKADAAFGLAALADQFGLPFTPLIEECFDILVDRWAWFEPPMQALLAFYRTDAFRKRAAELAGYDLSGFGEVRFNGARRG